MKKRTVLAMLTALTITASVFAGCGSSADAVPASNMTDKTGSALEDDESLKDNAAGWNINVDKCSGGVE